MKWKLILPALEEANGKYWRSIKYSLFPPLGLATLAGYIPAEDDIRIADEHVEKISLDDDPDIVLIEVYITNAYRAYKIADHYLKLNKKVILGGLHATSLPDEAIKHASSVVIGPGDHIFAQVVKDIKSNSLKQFYTSERRDLENIPPIRRDLIDIKKYLVHNSIVISRGCPYSCGFCYKEPFFKDGKSYYTYTLDKALEEIDSLKGSHLFFLDDNILAETQFTQDLFIELSHRKRIIQGAGTIKGILNEKLILNAAKAGLKSLFVGFESINKKNMASLKKHNYNYDYNKAIDILNDYGIKINASFVFGMDKDDKDVFEKTVEWAVSKGITTATFHVMTPYPGTALYKQLESENRIISQDWSLYNTRNVVFQPAKMTISELEEGYRKSYKDFYSYSNIFKSALNHKTPGKKLSSLCYSLGWKKMEKVWEFIIMLKKLSYSIPSLEYVLKN